jgi:hypothetical protein
MFRSRRHFTIWPFERANIRVSCLLTDTYIALIDSHNGKDESPHGAT